MNSRFEEMLVMHCAPTLAGHKCGSLFSYRMPEGAMSGLAACAKALSARGVKVALLGKCNSGWLGCFGGVLSQRSVKRRGVLSRRGWKCFLSLRR